MRRVDPGDAHTSEDQGCKMSESTKTAFAKSPYQKVLNCAILFRNTKNYPNMTFWGHFLKDCRLNSKVHCYWHPSLFYFWFTQIYLCYLQHFATLTKTHLYVILVDNGDLFENGETYAQQKELCQQAVKIGLLEEIKIPQMENHQLCGTSGRQTAVWSNHCKKQLEEF